MRRHRRTKLCIFLLVIALLVAIAGYGGSCGTYNPTPSENLEIRTWYDLDAVRDNLAGNHRLMNNLNSTTPGYMELAGPMADEGKGWYPIGIFSQGGAWRFTGTLDGQGYEICALSINRPYPEAPRNGIGLVGVLGEGGVVENIGVVNATVTGDGMVSGLVGCNYGNISNCYASGNVSGDEIVGGLVGLVGESRSENAGPGTVSNSYSTGNVTDSDQFGGLVGHNDEGTVSNSFWDTQTSGQATSDGGTGKTTAEMQDIATFSGAGWDIIAVADPGTRNPSYIWNIATTPPTYPFLSWEP